MSRREAPSARIEESVVIERPLERVFTFCQDFRNLPDFLGDVMRVEITGERTSRWTIRAPLGFELQWTVVITDLRPNAFIAYQTDSAIAPTRWEVSFSPGADPGATLVREAMSMPGGPIAKLALAAVGKPPAKEVHANLTRLKELLETGRVTTMDYAVAGKFAP
jgi:uncharacterized membrane protein